MKGLFQCPPWARSFWAFSPFLNHMRKFCYFTISFPAACQPIKPESSSIT